MPSGASDAAPKAASKPRATGVKEVDQAFERIREARRVAREELKSLRKQYKKDIRAHFEAYYVSVCTMRTFTLCILFGNTHMVRIGLMVC